MIKNTGLCLLTAVLLVILSNGFSQVSDTASNTLKYFNKTELGVSFGIGSFNSNVYSGANGYTSKVKNIEIPFTLQTVNGVMYNNRWMLGVSLGVEKWQSGLFWPVYGYLGYNFTKTDNTFFANIYLGYGIGTRYSTSSYNQGSGAFALMLGVGYRMKVTKNLRFGYEIFYKYQAINSSYNIFKYVTSDSIHYEWKQYSSTDNKVGLNFAGFKIAIFFP